MTNDTAIQTLFAPDITQVLWTRSGAAPEVSQVVFEQSIDDGNSWTALGNATRVASTSNWQLTNLNLPSNVQLRARGRATCGYQNGGSGLVDTVASFTGLLPPATNVAQVSPATGSIGGGTNVTLTGTGFTGASAVTIGGTAATNVVVINDSTITCTTPAHAAGVASVVVATPGGSNGANTLFTFLKPIEVWRQLHFGAYADGGNSANVADPDNDRMPNLAEYAFGLDPLNGSSLRSPVPQVFSGNYVVTFTQPAGVSGITYGAEWSTDLVAGSWTSIPDTGSGTIHTFSVPVGTNTRIFFRYVITEP